MDLRTEIDRQAERQERWPAASGDDSAETGDASVDWNAVVDGETPVLEFEAECTRDLMRVHADRKGDAGVDERLQVRVAVDGDWNEITDPPVNLPHRQSIGDRIDGVDQQLSELRSSLRSIEARLEDAARPRQSRSAPSFQRLSFASSVSSRVSTQSGTLARVSTTSPLHRCRQKRNATTNQVASWPLYSSLGSAFPFKGSTADLIRYIVGTDS